jgi:hypothetical protein
MALTDKALDSIGVAQVRANLATNVYLGNDRAIVVGWLARHDEASSAEQLNLSRSASTAAHKANRIALAALIIAVGSLILSTIGLFR